VNVDGVAAASLSPDPGEKVIRVFIVASVRLYREGLAAVLQRESGIEVVRAVADVGAFFRDPPCDAADVALLDMTVDGSFAAARRVSSVGSRPRIVAVAIPDAEDPVIACAEAGVHGYVTDDEPLDELFAAVESAARGEARCSPRVAAVLLRRIRSVAHLASPREAARLTSRELEIVSLIAQGLTNKEIAARLTIELPTVKNHVHNILAKVGVTHRAEAVHRIWSGGLLQPAAPVLAQD
jgi:two-component system, NarL family, nitrate/nitrite response regulator NarL